MGLIGKLYLTDDEKLLKNEPMKKHSSLQVGGNAKYYYIPKSIKSLVDAVIVAKENKIPVKVIGAGTNILVSDKGYDGLIIDTAQLNYVSFEGNKVNACCGVRLSELIKECAERGMKGLENLYGIPASVGGAIFMNGGAYGVSVGDCIKKVYSVKNGMLKTYSAKECEFGYRKSVFKTNKEIIISAVFEFTNGNSAQIEQDIKNVLKKRRLSQPCYRTCGSIFLNPKGFKVAELIEKARLKGTKIGGASVSNLHSNFIVTLNNATATDVFNLIQYIKTLIKNEFGVDLTEEVEYVGEF